MENTRVMNFLQSVKINGSSMAPTFRSGQRALFIKVRRPSKSLLGTVVLISRVNSQGVRDFYQVKRVTEYKDGRFYVSGDNTDASTDSREFGWLSGNEIVGRYLIKY